VWLGERSARKRVGGGVELIRSAGCSLLAGGLTLAIAALAPTAPADAQQTAPTSAGPDRIICNAAFCEMGSGAHPRERIRVIVSNLPLAEIRRLRKCTGVAKPCIVTIEGTLQDDQKQVMATSIHWQE
jgi:hypothetical protein